MESVSELGRDFLSSSTDAQGIIGIKLGKKKQKTTELLFVFACSFGLSGENRIETGFDHRQIFAVFLENPPDVVQTKSRYLGKDLFPESPELLLSEFRISVKPQPVFELVSKRKLDAVLGGFCIDLTDSGRDVLNWLGV